jgi:transposase-like protein
MGTTRRTYTPEFKVRVVLELISGKKSLGEASRAYGIKDSVLSRWRQEFLERAPQVFQEDLHKDAQTQQIAELEQVIGRLTVQLEMAKKVFGDSDYLSRNGG